MCSIPGHAQMHVCMHTLPFSFSFSLSFSLYAVTRLFLACFTVCFTSRLLHRLCASFVQQLKQSLCLKNPNKTKSKQQHRLKVGKQTFSNVFLNLSQFVNSYPSDSETSQCLAISFTLLISFHTYMEPNSYFFHTGQTETLIEIVVEIKNLCLLLQYDMQKCLLCYENKCLKIGRLTLKLVSSLSL